MIAVLSIAQAGCRTGTNEQPGSVISISVSPTSQTVIVGQTANFSVVAEGSGPIMYQWKKNGVDIAGATLPTYVTPMTAAGDDNAEFSVRLATGPASTTAAATLHVYEDTEVPAPNEYVIDPTMTDTTISPGFGNHYAYLNPAVSPKQKLFVFFPGTKAAPGYYRLLLQAAANNGFHVIGLAYRNGIALDVLCQGSADPDCHGKIREEIFNGKNVSGSVSVDAADAIENRLIRALQYLSRRNSQEAWGQYLNDTGMLQWSSIRLSGHSNGGGEAAYIAKQQLVDRACFFASPADKRSPENTVAAWVTAPGLTGAGSYYGFVHERDGVVPVATIQEEWAALHMDESGASVNVDRDTPPYFVSHMLFTNRNKPSSGLGADAPDAIAYHDITAVDAYTLLDSDGLPSYRFTWQYQCFL